MTAPTKFYSRIGATFAALLASVAIAQAQTGEVVVPESDRSCDAVVANFISAVRADEGALLKQVTNRVGESPWCACPLTKADIQTVDASAEMVGEIVFRATSAAPEQYKAIATCALEVAPDAAEEIRQALLKAFGETSSEGIVSTGKGKSINVADIVAPATTIPFRGGPSGFIDNVFVIPPAGVTPREVCECEEPPTDRPPPSDPPPSDPPPSDPPPSPPPPPPGPPRATDSDPQQGG